MRIGSLRIGSLILFFCFSIVAPLAQAAPGAKPVKFEPADEEQIKLFERVLGADALLEGATSFPPVNLIAKVELAEGPSALFALTRSACSNHACTIEVIVNQDDKWKHVASFETWAPPYVLDRSTNGMRDLIIFDHVTDDCMACSPPQPVRMKWDPAAQFSETQKGNYVDAGTIPKAEQRRYKLTSYPRLKD